jgi:hypothetical protein
MVMIMKQIMRLATAQCNDQTIVNGDSQETDREAHDGIFTICRNVYLLERKESAIVGQECGPRGIETATDAQLG